MKHIFRITTMLCVLGMLGGVNAAACPPKTGYDPALVKKLAVCITEGGLPLDAASVEKRFSEYSELGISCVRIDTNWEPDGKGGWTVSQSTENVFRAARKYGIVIKAIIPCLQGDGSDASRLMDKNGRLSINTVSCWFDGVIDCSRTALSGMLTALEKSGYKDVVGAVIPHLGPAGEPLYPPAWTQVTNGLDSTDNGEEVMWCYADNAQADFRAKMKKKYKSILFANLAWGTSYRGFDEINVPAEGEASGRMWSDVLLWYRDSKRELVSGMVKMCRSVLNDFDMEDIPLVLYLPGADFTESAWDECVKEGTAKPGIKLMCDNAYTVKLAKKYKCLLQYTGITGKYELTLLRSYMYHNGYADIPVFGENAGDPISDGDPMKLADIISEYKLYWLDYTHSRLIYEQDGTTHGAIFGEFSQAVKRVSEYLESVDISAQPDVTCGVCDYCGNMHGGLSGLTIRVCHLIKHLIHGK